MSPSLLTLNFSLVFVTLKRHARKVWREFYGQACFAHAMVHSPLDPRNR